ncbi:unnamed protein product [Nippostrongylus brasiliensis]|uniref:Cytochrome P450 n=1 Tax=Nippostrongylus brasiliensis TaxID=27835 RepID=A0A158QZC4_NIPBR|nr:unnamed protein product [Nippostrongylus brasiliensis]
MMLLAPLIALVVFALVYHFYWKRRGLPPGSFKQRAVEFRVTSSIFHLMSTFPSIGYEAFRIWKQKYGRCFTFWMGPRPAVVLADYELIKDTIVKDGAAYTGRMENPFSRTVRGGNYGIIESSGALWQQHRRFALHVFRDFGMGKDVMEERVLVEVSDLLRKCAESRGSPINLRSHIDAAVGSVINGLLFGYRFDEVSAAIKNG